MTAMKLHRYPSPSGGFALGKVGVGATLLKQGKTARDYVQDGLVAMWDGIENAGWGVHDANATAWKELVSGNVVALSNANATYSWNSNCLVVSREATASTGYIMNFSGTAMNAALNSASSFTAEIVAVRDDDYTASPDSWLQSTTSYPFQFQTYRTTAAITYYTNNNSSFLRVVHNTKVPFTASLVQIKEGGKSAYLNGSLGASDDTSTNPTFTGIRITNRGGQKRRFCIRIYSRALTADEIAHNYAIDKERFNLP